MIAIYKKKNKGFTIVETLVALSIFTFCISVLIAVAGQGTSNTISSSQRVVADYLAQEGVEIVRNMRDTAIISVISGNHPTAWSGFLNNATPYTNSIPAYSVPIDGINDCTTAGGINKACTVSFILGAPSISPCPVDSALNPVCPYLSYDPNFGSYGYIYTDPTSFQRVVTVTYPDPSNTNEVRVDSTVHFGGSGQQSITYSEYLFNWPK